MTGYILSILGIVIAGVVIDIIIPSGTLNKYIKAIYSIFVVAVLISPLVKVMSNIEDFKITYIENKIDIDLLNYIYKMRAKSVEENIENYLKNEGLNKIDIILEFSIENEQLKYISCSANLNNLVISADKQHINKYELIKKVIRENTDLTDERIFINGWKTKKTSDKVIRKIKKC